MTEVKWGVDPVGTDILRTLRAKAVRVVWGRPGRREVFALFSRKGFTPDVRRLARDEGVLLFEGDQRVQVGYGNPKETPRDSTRAP